MPPATTYTAGPLPHDRSIHLQCLRQYHKSLGCSVGIGGVAVQVLLQIIISRADLAACGAGVALLCIHVGFHVPRPRAWRHEARSADATGVWAVARVGVDVVRKSCSSDEGLAAGGAGVGAVCFRVDALHVSCQVVCPPEGLAACDAGEWAVVVLHGSVDGMDALHVSRHVGFTCEGHAACDAGELAVVGPHGRVDGMDALHVSRQPREGLAAYDADVLRPKNSGHACLVRRKVSSATKLPKLLPNLLELRIVILKLRLVILVVILELRLQH